MAFSSMRTARLSKSILLTALLLMVEAPLASAAETNDRKRVLILYQEASFLPAITAVDEGIRAALQSSYPGSIEFYTEYLDLTRFGGDPYESDLVSHLNLKYADRNLDLIFAAGRPVLEMLLKHRNKLLPETPIVFLATDQSFAESLAALPGITGACWRVDFEETLKVALRLQPDTKRVVVVNGAGPTDRLFDAFARQQLRLYEDKLQLVYLTGLTMNDLIRELAGLTEDTIVLYGTVLEDGAGASYTGVQALRSILPLTSAPIYGIADTSFGDGIVGGSLIDFKTHGSQAGQLGVRVLQGEDPESIPILSRTSNVYMFDWRQLRRWGISEADLPPGSVVRFREFSAWQHYKWHIIGIVSLCILEAVLIFALLAQRKKRRFAQRALEERYRFEALISELSASLIHLPADEVGGHIHEGLRRVCEFLNTDLAVLSRYSPQTRTFQAEESYLAEELKDAVPADEKVLPVYFAEKMLKGELARFAGLGELPAEARSDFQKMGIKSHLSLPIGGGTLAALSLSTLREERTWPDDLAQRLGLVGDVFANVLLRNRIETDLRLSREALRASQERLQAILDSSPAFVYIKDLDGRYSLVNRQLEKLLQLSHEQILGRTDYDLFPKAQADTYRANDNQVLQTLEPVYFEETVLQNDGPRTYVSIKVPLSERGAPYAICGISTDITQRKRAEEALRETEAKFRQLVESTKVIAWESDFKTNRFTYVSSHAFELFGYEPESWYEEDFWPHHIHPEDREDAINTCLSLSQKFDNFDFEYRMVASDGRVVWLHDIVSVERDGKAPKRLRGYMIDFTERKRAEEQLRSSEALSTSVLASLSGSVAIIDKEGTIIGANKSNERRGSELGANRYANSSAGANYIEVLRRLATDGDTTAYRILNGVLSVIQGSRSEFSLEYSFRAPVGERWATMSVQPLLRPEGGAVISHMDTTDQKQAELDVQRHRQELAHVTRVATMGELTASLAHEVNQPLTAIRANSQAAQRFLLTDTPDLDEVREIMADIVADNRRAAEVVSRLRTLLKKGDLEMTAQDLNSIVEGVVKLVRSDAVIKRIVIDLDLDPKVPPVIADRVQLQQVLLNLIMNAMDAMKDTSGEHRKLIIRAARHDDGCVQVSIRDFGTGIESASLARLLEPFYTTKPEGMGMGLSICRTILEAHGGRLWAENNPDRGATFHFTLLVNQEKNRDRG
jgi:PAS domain S-box-containing protein